MYRPIVVSLFNGIGVGSLALHRLGVVPRKVYVSEVDPAANRVARSHTPDAVFLGGVEGVGRENVDEPVGILMGGSPCQSFSVAGDGKGFKDRRGNLLFQFYRLVQELRPRWFLLENVVMARRHHLVVSKLLGVEPVVLDSSWWCAQQRLRMYWTNIPVASPPESEEVLADVMGEELVGGWSPIPVRTGTVKNGGQGDRIYSPNGKGITLSASSGGTAGPANMLVGRPGRWRKLTVEEAERLQMLPPGYTRAVPMPDRRRLIGNAWTCGVIEHILSGIPDVEAKR